MTATPPTSADIELHADPDLTLDRRTRLQTTWNSLLGEITQGDLRATALTTGLQLMEEIEAMYHAVREYVPQCIAGRSRIFTIARSSKKEATAEICLSDGRWNLTQLVGPHFTHHAPHVERLALEIATLYQQRWDSLPAPKHSSWQDETIHLPQTVQIPEHP